jgi:DNA replicative helicase MCM subunit Mcm2 (Cdc46/Mcm family)
MAREHNTVIIEIASRQTQREGGIGVGEGEEERSDDAFVIRRNIDFKNWNKFIAELKKNIATSLASVFDNKKQLSRLIAAIETVLNNNYDKLIEPIRKNFSNYDTSITNNGCNSSSDGNSNSNISHNEQKQREQQLNEEEGDSIGNSSSVPPSSFVAVNELSKKQSGTYITKGEVVSMTEVMHAIHKIEWECDNPSIQNPCLNPSNEAIFDPPIFRIGGLHLRCRSCSHSKNYVEIDRSDLPGTLTNYVVVQLQEPDNTDIDNLQKLTAVVYDEDIDKVHIAGVYDVRGKIVVPLKPFERPYPGRTSSSIGSLSSVLYVEKIQQDHQDTDGTYKNSNSNDDNYSIADRDIEAFRRFAAYPRLMDRLASMFAPKIIGHQDKKIAILLSAVGGVNIPNRKKRGRIHVLFVGPPGLSKTTLSYEATALLPGSRFTSVQTSSVKTLLAIVEVLDDVKIIRYGAIPLARDAICVIDEIGAMSYDDQSALYNVMEHGEIPLAKYGETRTILSPTSILATSNPRNMKSNWSTDGRASKEEIPLRRALIDRFDLPLNFPDDQTDEESAANYAKEKMRVGEMQPHNYRYLRRYLQYARRTMTDVKFTKGAEAMLVDYYSRIKSNKNLEMTPRAFDVLTRIAEAWAKIHLKDVVDADVMGQVQTYFSIAMLQYGEVINASADPREVACDEIIKVIKMAECSISFEEAVSEACKLNEQVSFFVGPNRKLRDSRVLYDISTRIKEYSNIEVVGLRPLVLKWKKAATASSASAGTEEEEKEKVGPQNVGKDSQHHHQEQKQQESQAAGGDGDGDDDGDNGDGKDSENGY